MTEHDILTYLQNRERVKCKIFVFSIMSVSDTQQEINTFLKTITKIILVTQSQVGQGTASITIFYNDKAQDSTSNTPAPEPT